MENIRKSKERRRSALRRNIWTEKEKLVEFLKLNEEGLESVMKKLNKYVERKYGISLEEWRSVSEELSEKYRNIKDLLSRLENLNRQRQKVVHKTISVKLEFLFCFCFQ